jgi:hypothetical protein
MEAQPKGSADTIGMLRLWILGVLVLGLLGTVVELVLLSHYEQAVQLVPVVLIVLALIVLAWHVMGHSVAGFVAHFHGSAEFQLDLEPSLSTWELLEKVMRAKAPPLLAPGMMMQLGLLGLAYVFSDKRYRRS